MDELLSYLQERGAQERLIGLTDQPGVAWGFPPGELNSSEFLARYGKPMRRAPLTVSEARLVVRTATKASAASESERPPGVDWFKPRECYYNAQLLALEESQLVYCEGVYWGLVPVQHAWVTLNGKVVDLTIRNNLRRNLSRTDRALYYGVKIPTDRALYYGVEIPTPVMLDLILGEREHVDTLSYQPVRRWIATNS